MRKPNQILYGVGDVPPPLFLMLLGAQHVLVLSIFLFAQVAIARAAGLPLDRASDIISLTMIGLAASSLLQIRRRGPFGSGLLVIPTSSGNYIPGCIIAARMSGWPGVMALLLGSAVVELVLSRFLKRLRGALPAELSGLIVLVTGIAIAQTGMEDVIGSVAAQAPDGRLAPLLVAAGTLGVMVGCSVWGRGPLRTLGAVVGLAAGYAGGLAAGLVDAGPLDLLQHAPLLRLPSLPPQMPIFSVGLVLPALVTGLAVTLNGVAALTAAQQLGDADWKRQDFEGLSRGLLADGLGTMFTVLIGGGGVAASGSSVGLSANARATSPAIGYVVATGFAVLAMVPKFPLLMLTVPQPVLGAAFVYLSCSLMISGISIMSSRLLDMRKAFTLGVAFAFAVATPALARAGPFLPEWIAPIATSPLLASAVVALILNPILRLGIRQQVVLVIPMDGLPHETVSTFITQAGAAWGARREVIDRAQGPIAECLDTLNGSGLALGEKRLTLGFNELALDARITWQGAPIPLSAARPTKEEFLRDDDASARMAGYLIRRLSSKVRSRSGDGTAELHMIFDH